METPITYKLLKVSTMLATAMLISQERSADKQWYGDLVDEENGCHIAVNKCDLLYISSKMFVVAGIQLIVDVWYSVSVSS